VPGPPVDLRRGLGVQPLGHQKGARQRPEHPLDRALPFALTRVDVDELAGERELGGLDAEPLGQLAAGGQQGRFHIGALGLEDRERLGEPLRLLPGLDVAALSLVVGGALGLLLTLDLGECGVEQRLPVSPLLGRAGQRHIAPLGLLSSLEQVTAAPGEGGLVLAAQPLQIGYPVPAETGDPGPAALSGGDGVLLPLRGGRDLGAQALQRRPVALDERVGDLDAPRGEEGLGVVLLGLEQGEPLDGPPVGGRDRLQRLQGGHLIAGLHHRPVSPRQLLELVDGLVGQGEGVRLVEHEVAQQGVEIAQILGGLGLVQQPLGLVGGQPELALDPVGEGGVVLGRGPSGMGGLDPARVDAIGGQRLQGLQIDGLVGVQIEAVDVARAGGLLGGVHQPDEGDGAPGGVIEGQRDPAPGGPGAQVCGGDLAGGVVDVAPVRPAHIAEDVARTIPLAALLGGRIEGEPTRLDHHRGDGVQQGGLPRSGGSGDENPLAGHGDIAVAVEGAPVHQLDPAQPELAGEFDSGLPGSVRNARNA
jgi:hypothetical protein